MHAPVDLIARIRNSFGLRLVLDAVTRTCTASREASDPTRFVSAVLCSAALATVTFAHPGAAAALSAEEWQADLIALQVGLARNYANFEYTLTDRRIDLPLLAARSRDALASAPDDSERRRVFERLLRDLRDPHVSISWPREGPGTAVAASNRDVPTGAGDDVEKPPPGAACPSDLASLSTRPGVAFARLPGYQALPDPEARWFDAGLVRDSGHPTLGVLRLSIFIERAYAPACAEAAKTTGLELQAPCDDGCVGRIERATAQRLNAALARTVRELERAGAKQLVVDVTDNDGGSDWAEVVARLLGGPLRSARVALLKHPAWRSWLDARIAELEAAHESASPPQKERRARASREYTKLREKVSSPCDLSSAWTDRELAIGRKPLPCTTLVTGGLYATGAEAGLPPPPADATDADGLLFRVNFYGPAPVGVTRLPIVIVVNGETHSAAEQFAAVLRDNGRAHVVGTPTAGAGCGTYTDKGTGFTLPATGAEVHVPDCVRLRADGSNERRGIVPDRLIPWAPSDSVLQRAQKTLHSLQPRTDRRLGDTGRPADTKPDQRMMGKQSANR
jgi:hypothetical protein